MYFQPIFGFHFSHYDFLRFSGELTCGGPWISLFPEAVLPPKGTEARDAMEADMEPGK